MLSDLLDRYLWAPERPKQHAGWKMPTCKWIGQKCMGIPYFKHSLWIMVLTTFQTDIIFKQYKKNSGWYVRYTGQLQQLFTSRFVASDKDRKLFKTFANLFEASYWGTEPTLQFELIYLPCGDGLRFKFKEGNLHKFYKRLPKDKYPNLGQKAAVCANLFENTFVNKLSQWWS